MLVPTMTPEEIFAEISKDEDWIREQVGAYAIQYGKRVLKQTRFPDMYVYAKESKHTRIIYNFILYSYRRGEWKNPQAIVYTSYAFEGGTIYILLDNPPFSIRLYTTHFFARYKERQFDKLTGWKSFATKYPQVFFILRNRDVYPMNFIHGDWAPESVKKILKETEAKSKFEQDPNYKRIMMGCMDGVCLCENNKKDERITIYNTFIPHELMRLDQHIDYLIALPYLILHRMEHVYPNQRATWGKEWNEMVDAKTETYEEFANKVCNKLIEFSERYPLPEII